MFRLMTYVSRNCVVSLPYGVLDQGVEGRGPLVWCNLPSREHEWTVHVSGVSYSHGRRMLARASERK
jgi:hypothetical protein